MNKMNIANVAKQADFLTSGFIMGLFVILARACTNFCSVLKSIAADWRSMLFGTTKRMPGCRTTVAMASASVASFLTRFTKGFT